MSIQARRERERAEREKLIVTAARELAEAEGWDAVTTRRLAERVEYSQPVLYSHFRGKDAIVTAVAMEGFTSLAEELSAARASVPAAEALAAIGAAYTAFADRRPVLYDAMFSQTVDCRSRPPRPRRRCTRRSTRSPKRSARTPAAPTWAGWRRRSGPPCTAWSP